MASPSRHVSNARPRSKSPISNLERSRPSSSSRNGSLTVPTSPSPPTTFPSTAAMAPGSTPNTPAQSDNPSVNNTPNNNTTPRKNGRRRYTPRQIPASAYCSPQQSSPPRARSQKSSPSEADVAQF